MTLRLTPVVNWGEWTGRWLIAADDGAHLGDVHVTVKTTFPAIGVPPVQRDLYVADVADVQVTGATLARTMTAVAAVLEHAAGYVVVDEPAPPWAPQLPVSRVIPAAERSPIRVDEATSTPVDGIPARPTIPLHIDRVSVPAT